ncbi:MAG: succinate dehydrogenase, hydrophobic membrane anchor protein [Hydrogenophilaceae bacterium]
MRTVGGARRGLTIWLVQRAGAVVMAAYLPLFALYAWLAGSADYAGWRGLFEPLAAKVTTLLFFAALLSHAWIGMREIVIDYVHCPRCLGLRLALHFSFAVLYLACLVWTADILWTLA